METNMYLKTINTGRTAGTAENTGHKMPHVASRLIQSITGKYKNSTRSATQNLSALKCYFAT